MSTALLNVPQPPLPLSPATIAENATTAKYPQLWRGLVWSVSAVIDGGARDLAGRKSPSDRSATITGDHWSFNGSSQFIRFADDDSFDDFSRVSVFAVIRKESEGDPDEDTILDKWDTGSGRSYLVRYDSQNNQLDCFISDGTTDKSAVNGVSIEGAGWVLVGFTYDGATLRPYLNAEALSTTTAATITVGPSDTPVTLGRRNAGGGIDYLNGDIAEAWIYDRCLSPNEVALLARLPRGEWAARRSIFRVGSGEVTEATNKLLPYQMPVPLSPATIAENATTAKYPQLWRGLIHAWSATICRNPKDLRKTHNGTYQANAALSGDGQSFTFDGTGDYISCGNKVGPAKGCSVSAWFNTDTTSASQMILSMYDNSPADAYIQFYHVNGGGLKGRIHDTRDTKRIGRISDGSLISTNTWHHGVMTWDGGTTNSSIRLYLDGKQVDTTDDGAGTFTAASTGSIHLWLGAQDFGGADTEWDGELDDVLMYDRALTPNEVALIAQLPRGEWARRRTFRFVGSGEVVEATNKLLPYQMPVPLCADTVRMKRPKYPTLHRGLVGAWSARIAPTAHDLSGGKSHGVLTSGTVLGRFGWEFDGSNDSINMGDAARLEFDGTGPFSLACWCKRDSATRYNNMITKLYDPGSSQIRGYMFTHSYVSSNSYVEFWLMKSVAASTYLHIRTTNAYNATDEWEHWCVTYCGTSQAANCSLYRNGDPVATSIILDLFPAGGGSSNEGNFLLGNRHDVNSQVLDGYLDDCLVWDRELNPNEVAVLGRLPRGEWARQQPLWVGSGSGEAATVLGLATESNTALSLTGIKARSLGLTSEADSALSLARAKAKSLGLTSEANTSLAVSRSKQLALGLTSETDTGLTLSRLKQLGVGLSVETNEATVLTKLKSLVVGLSPETNSGLSVALAKQQSVGLGIETDLGLGLAGLKQLLVGLSAETNLGLALSGSKNLLVGLVVEADSGLAITSSKLLTVGLSQESDSGLVLGFSKQKLVGLVTEVDSALVVTPTSPTTIVSVGLATEIDTTFGLSRTKLRSLGLALETDLAFSILIIVPVTFVIFTDVLGVHSQSLITGQHTNPSLLGKTSKSSLTGL